MEKEKDALQALNSIPLGSAKRVVVVEGFEKMERLRDYMLQPHDLCTAIFLSGDDYNEADFIPDIQKRREDLSLAYVKCYPLVGEKLEDWVFEKVEKEKGRIERAAVERLCYLVGNDLYQLEMELRKLLAINPLVRVQEVETYTARLSSRGMANFVDAVASRDKKKAVILMEAIDLQTTHTQATAFLSSRFRDLFWINSLREQRVKGWEMATVLGVPPYFIPPLAIQSKLFVQEELEVIFRRLYQVDKRCRYSQFGSIDLEHLIFDILNGRICYERRNK